MSMAGTLLLLIFPILFLLALVIGLGVFLAVRKNERKSGRNSCGLPSGAPRRKSWKR